ncbi:MAG: hypothetical protein KF744_14475 [Taibaiella sp.]|nr:hypothetical protein [Taibaiella sp.]
MSKAQRQIKHTDVRHANAMGRQIEHTETVDDNLLPEAAEIERLHKMDPTILEWLKCRAEKEQDWRHEYHDYRADLIHDNERNNRLLNTLGLIFAFIIFVGGMLCSYLLIMKDHVLTGTIFCGGTLAAGAGLFINRQGQIKKQANQSKANNVQQTNNQ